MIEFLSRVLSPAGFTCIATPAPEPYKGFNHYRLTEKDKIKWIIEKLHTEKKNVYFAIGTLKEKQITVGDKVQIRVAANIHEIKSLILDLDVGEAKQYKTQKEAIAHLLQFTKAISFPTPFLVSSGYGVHVYWPFTQALPAESWRVLANKFKTLTESFGLHADPNRTADSSSVLRVPGTSNFKDPTNPQPVKILNKNPVQDTPSSALEILIDTALSTLGVTAKPLKSSSKKDVTGLGSFTVAQEPSSFKEIVRRCQQIQWAYSHQDACSEPMWYHGLQLIRHCAEPEKMYVAFSNKHPGYDPEIMLEKVQQHIDQDNGPTLCTTFESKCRPGGCAGCPHLGKITSPITLGRVTVAITEPIQLVVTHGNGEVTTVEIPPAPYPYMRTTAGGIAKHMKDDKGHEVDPEVIYDYDMYPIKRMFDEVEQTEVYTFRHHLPKDPHREFVVPAYLLYDPKKIMETLGRIGVLPERAYKDEVVNYMLGYIRSLQENVSASQIYSQMGWRNGDTEIVIGDRAYTKEGVKIVKVSDQFKHVINKFSQQGDIAAWSKVANIYNVPGAEEFAFGLMMGMGQLAFKFTGYEGATFNFNGESGSGKSTVLQVIHSIYGLPTEKALLHQDTTNAKLTMLGCYNNLPVTYDEISNIDPSELSDLMYAISNGRGKESLKQDRTLRANMATWQTVAFCSSNGSMSQRLVNLKGTSSGETYRLMERNVHLTARYSLNQAQTLFEPLQSNYGLAGGLIADWLVNHVEETQDLMREYVSMINEKVSAISSERFWVAMCAQAMFGAYVGQELKLCAYTVDAMLTHSIKVITEMRGGAVAETKTPVDILVEYMNVHIKNTLVIRMTPSGVGAVVLHPNGNMVIRHELDSHKVWVTKSAFKQWCSDKNHDVFAVEHYLEGHGLLLGDNVSKALGDNTEYLTGRLPCYLINSNHSLMTGVPSLHIVDTTQPQEERTSAASAHA